MNQILEILALICILVGTSALYLFLVKSFNQAQNIKKTVSPEREKLIQQKTTYFIISLIVSEILGIFFLSLTGSLKNSIITLNGFAFLVASCLCSIITIVNAVRLEKINLLVRVTTQFLTLFFALIFIRISIEIPDLKTLEQLSGRIALFLQFFAVFYFATSVSAVLLILWDAIKIEIEYLRNYLVWVLVIGITVGTGLYIISFNWKALLI
ncbi:hypothetical protein L0128_02255 [candidate division KSB1 bacterium]|nr:hypothetical protein [candidate division KSB1 bacterium]